MLTGKYWITPEATVQLVSKEHAIFALGIMLNYPRDERLPDSWFGNGVPKEQLEAALERGADPKAIKFLEKPGADPRLYAIREYGWVRITKNKFDVWVFDDSTAELVRNADGYWSEQYARDLKYEVMEIYELKDGDKYTVDVKKILDGGSPEILRDLAHGRIDRDTAEAKLSPMYSARFSELEKRRLSGRTGDNPKRRRR